MHLFHYLLLYSFLTTSTHDIRAVIGQCQPSIFLLFLAIFWILSEDIFKSISLEIFAARSTKKIKFISKMDNCFIHSVLRAIWKVTCKTFYISHKNIKEPLLLHYKSKKKNGSFLYVCKAGLEECYFQQGEI